MLFCIRRFLARRICPVWCVALGPFGPITCHTPTCGRPNPY